MLTYLLIVIATTLILVLALCLHNKTLASRAATLKESVETLRASALSFSKQHLRESDALVLRLQQANRDTDTFATECERLKEQVTAMRSCLAVSDKNRAELVSKHEASVMEEKRLAALLLRVRDRNYELEDRLKKFSRARSAGGRFIKGGAK